MKKQINFRPIFYCFIALGLGIYFARSIFSANIYIIFALSLALIALTVICIKYKCVKRLIILCSTFVLGVGIFALSLVTFSGNNFTNGTYTVSGRIVIVNDYSGMQNVILDNVYIAFFLFIEVFSELDLYLGPEHNICQKLIIKIGGL